MIKIEIGSHLKEKPASFTRFVLPFAYHLKESQENVQDPVYERIEIPDRIWREKYLTEETARVLFHRAQWFTLKPKEKDEWKKIELKFRDGMLVPVCTAPPSLVLFEWPMTLTGNVSVNLDLLQTGFLLVDLYFPNDLNDRPNLDDLLELNEQFRYWQHPFAGHECRHGCYRELLAQWPVDHKEGKKVMGDPDASLIEMYLERWAS